MWIRCTTSLRSIPDARSRVDNIPGRKATFPSWPKRIAQPLSTVSTHISILNDGPRHP